MDMLRCYNSLYIRRRYEILNSDSSSNSRIHYNTTTNNRFLASIVESINTVNGIYINNDNYNVGFEFSSLPPIDDYIKNLDRDVFNCSGFYNYNPLLDGISDNIMDKYNDVKYVLDTYNSDYDNNKIIFSSIYMTSPYVNNNSKNKNKLSPGALSCYRFELERIEEYIKKYNNYKNNKEDKEHSKWTSKYPAFPYNYMSMQFYKNGKEVIKDN